jgi:hypothetical protein
MGGVLKSIGGILEKAIGMVAQMALTYFTGGMSSMFGEVLSNVGGDLLKSVVGGAANDVMGQAGSLVSQNGLGMVAQAFGAATSNGSGTNGISDMVGAFTGALRNSNTASADITGMGVKNLADIAAYHIGQHINGRQVGTHVV